MAKKKAKKTTKKAHKKAKKVTKKSAKKMKAKSKRKAPKKAAKKSKKASSKAKSRTKSRSSKPKAVATSTKVDSAYENVNAPVSSFGETSSFGSGTFSSFNYGSAQRSEPTLSAEEE
jgi:membrane protein involved in colicin uptake